MPADNRNPAATVFLNYSDACAMNAADSRQTIVDDEHLKLLSWGYVFSGVMTALFSLLGLFYAGMGLLMSTVLAAAAKSGSHAESMPPESLGAIFGIFGLIIFLFAISLAIAKFVAASCIRRRKSRTLCLVVAGVSCLGIPYGTVLGVCTFMVLGRESVVQQFAVPRAL
jgi:hypothetical protein